MRFYYMERNLNSTPQLVHIYLKDYGPLIGNKDTAFLDGVTDAVSRKIYSSVYLTIVCSRSGPTDTILIGTSSSSSKKEM